MNELKTGATDMKMTLMPSKTHLTQRTDEVSPLDELLELQGFCSFLIMWIFEHEHVSSTQHTDQ